MHLIDFSARRAKRLSLFLALAVAIAFVALGFGALCVADSRRAVGRAKLEPPTRPAAALSDSRTPGQNSPAPHGPRTVHFDLLAKLLADDRRSDPGRWRQELADPTASCRIETQPHPLLGKPAPDFTLCDHRGQPWNLGQQIGQGPVVAIFYLGYSCNACVHHLCELSADVERFHELGASVVAISADPPELTRQRFDQYGALGFPVLSDPGHAVARQYETLRPAALSASADESEPEQPLHGTFIVDGQGMVCWANRGEVPFRGNLALLYQLSQLENRPLPEPAEARGP